MKTLSLIVGLILIAPAALANHEQEREAAAIEALKESVRTLSAADLSCTHNPQCGWYAIGKKACGGPAGYVVGSRRNLNLQEIAYLANQSTHKEHTYNLRWNVMSDCEYEFPPRVGCVNNTCQRVESDAENPGPEKEISSDLSR